MTRPEFAGWFMVSRYSRLHSLTREELNSWWTVSKRNRLTYMAYQLTTCSARAVFDSNIVWN